MSKVKFWVFVFSPTVPIVVVYWFCGWCDHPVIYNFFFSIVEHSIILPIVNWFPSCQLSFFNQVAFHLNYLFVIIEWSACKLAGVPRNTSPFLPLKFS